MKTEQSFACCGATTWCCLESPFDDSSLKTMEKYEKWRGMISLVVTHNQLTQPWVKYDKDKKPLEETTWYEILIRYGFEVRDIFHNKGEGAKLYHLVKQPAAQATDGAKDRVAEIVGSRKARVEALQSRWEREQQYAAEVAKARAEERARRVAKEKELTEAQIAATLVRLQSR